MQIGEKINHLTFIERLDKVRSNWYGLFECDCANKTRKRLRITAVSSYGTKSCGCHRIKNSIQQGKKSKTHGLTKHPLYNIWTHIKSICYNPQCKQYIEGIEICPEWQDFQIFYNWAIEQGWKKGLVITRIVEELDFYPENCQLVTSKESKNKNMTITSRKRYGCDRPQQNEIVKLNIKNKNLEKYGITSTAKLDSTKKTTRDNNIKKYGVDHPHKLEKNRQLFRQKTIDNGQAKVFEGKTASQWATEKGLAASCIHQRIIKFGYEEALKMDKWQTAIEHIMEEFLKSTNIPYQKQVRIGDRYADFLLDNKLVVETDGLYWHSDAVNKDKYYHRNKQRLYSKNSYSSLFFRENEIHYKFEIVKSIILNKLGKSNRIFGRKCKVVELSFAQIKDFLKENHLMGCGQGRAVGLTYNDELVTVLQFIRKSTHIEVSRFCHKKYTGIVGGFSKLLAQLIRTYSPNNIHTFIDRRYGSGLYLDQMGFKLVNNDVSFVWTRDLEVFHRMVYPGNSGYEARCNKLWDCGQASYLLKIT